MILQVSRIYLVGSLARAPQWMQKTGLEWIFRITQDPKRLWKRYFIDSSGLGFIVGLWRRAKAGNKKLSLIEIQPSVRRFFELSRTLDVFEGRVFHDVEAAMAQIVEKTDQPPFYYIEVPYRRLVLLRLYGTLDAAQMNHLDIETILNVIENLNCLLDLKNLAFVDSSDIVFFLKIQKHVQKIDKACVLFGLQENVRQMFRITKLDRLFKITPDMISAERYLEKDRRRESKG